MSKTKEVKAKEPLFHIVARDVMHPGASFGIRVAAFVVALLLSALFVWVTVNVDLITFLKTMFRGAFGMDKVFEAEGFENAWTALLSSYMWATLKAAAKLLIIAVALGPAFKMRFWNVGAEGQVIIGAMAAAFVMYHYSTMPGPLLLLVMLVVSILAGGIWGLIPAFFKTKLNTNETLFTLMMNYIAMKIADYFYNLWRGAKSALGMINQTSRAGWLRSLWSGKDAAWFRNEDLWFMIIVLVFTVLMFFYLKSTKQGYEIAVVGESHNTARYAGISVTKVMLRTMAISGAICGICGFLLVSSQSHTINSAMAGGFGFTAIIVAWLSKFNSFTMIGTSVLIVALQNGSMLMANTYSDRGFSPSAADVIVAIMLLMVIGCEFFIKYRVMFKHSAKEAKA